MTYPFKVLVSGVAGSGKTATGLLLARALSNSWEGVHVVCLDGPNPLLYREATCGGVRFGAFRATAPRASDAAGILAMLDGVEADCLLVDGLDQAWAGKSGAKTAVYATAGPAMDMRLLWDKAKTRMAALVSALRDLPIPVVCTAAGGSAPGKDGRPRLQDIDFPAAGDRFDVVLMMTPDHACVPLKWRANERFGVTLGAAMQPAEAARLLHAHNNPKEPQGAQDA